jgi:hypothetical protein
MIQLFDATFPPTAGEFELMIRVSDNITSRQKQGESRGGEACTRTREQKNKESYRSGE